jgi:hypothetical protein
MNSDIYKIVYTFNKNIKNKKYVKKDRHCGIEGHWLETQFNLKINSSNRPDLYGFEIKKESNKITFGDYSASEYLYSNKKRIHKKL